jgi:hypothetical protein
MISRVLICSRKAYKTWDLGCTSYFHYHNYRAWVSSIGGRGNYRLVIWFRVTRKPEYISLIRNRKGKKLVVVRKDISTLRHHTWGKLYCVVWMWFKSFDGFLANSLSIAYDEDLFVLINLIFLKFLWKRSM